MLLTRIYTVLVLLPMFVAALFFTPVAIWALVLSILVLAGAWEWGALAGWQSRQRVVYVAWIALGALLLWHFGYRDIHSARAVSVAVLGASVLFWLMAAPWWLAAGWRARAALPLALAGAVLLLPLWLALVQLHGRPWVLLVLMAIVWISDTAAYFCGKRWGRRKLAVRISPGKTWEGVLGALIAVAIYYVLARASGFSVAALSPAVFGFGVFMLLAVLGIEGDLFESWIKRTAGVKDSGTVFPGHGGVLDRIDALTASMPTAALILSEMA